jgi:hypothetical protein
MNRLITIPAHEVTSLAHGVTTDDDTEALHDAWERDAAMRRGHDLGRWQLNAETRVKFRI